MASIYQPDFDVEQDNPPYTWRRARLSRQTGAEQLGASLFEVPPGAATFPLHARVHNEELLVVVSGRPTLRTFTDEQMLEPGEVIACRAGRDGAHLLRNDTDEPVRVLIVSTMLAPEINLLPDTGELWVRDFAPGTDAPPGALDVRVAVDDTEV